MGGDFYDLLPLSDEHGVLLGTGLADLLPTRTSTTRQLPAGAQIMLFTDGLTEQPDPGTPGAAARVLDAGTTRLAKLWSALSPGAPPERWD